VMAVRRRSGIPEGPEVGQTPPTPVSPTGD